MKTNNEDKDDNEKINNNNNNKKNKRTQTNGKNSFSSKLSRKKFATFLEDKFGARPPLEGNIYLNNLIINLYMVLDGTERSMMQAVLNSNQGLALIQAIDRTPKDENLLRHFRHELDEQYITYHHAMERGNNQNIRQS